ncbi:MAG: diguanylate cyclase, partial [Oscillospiraceae bacterium]|nr:diguanylate cyclase [Oscillospiraceae bacterium]
MKQSIHRSRRSSQQRAVSVMIGIAVNVLLAYIAYRTGLPIYLDTVGTISIAALGGLFPGIMTAICTNAVCSGFNHPAIYFGGVNALIAIYTAWFVRSKSVRRTRNVIRFILTTGTIS